MPTKHMVFNSSSLSRRQPLLSSSSFDRRQPLLRSSTFDHRLPPARGGRRFMEVAGGATAECAAVACCCPCGIANLLILAMYKVPAGLWRKALMLRHKRRQRLMRKEGLLPAPGMCGCGYCDAAELEIDDDGLNGDPVLLVKAMEMDADMMQLEKEMWDKFYGTGFWRSPSQRTDHFGR